MKAKKLIFLICTVVIVLIVATIIAYANKLNIIAFTKIDAFARDQEDKKAASLGATALPETVDFYEECMNKAQSQEQKDKLNELKNDYTLGWGYYKRAALITIGELPKGQRRLIYGEAKKIVKDTNDIDTIKAMFNKIAGAPDFDGGSGISVTVYYLNDKKSEAITLILSKVLYETYDANGKRIQAVPLGSTIVPSAMNPLVETTHPNQ